MFFGCRASGEKNDVKSNIISAYALIISHVYHMCKKGARRGSDQNLAALTRDFCQKNSGSFAPGRV